MLGTRASGRREPPDATSRFRSVSSIGVLREGPLHAAGNAMLAAAGNRMEVPVGRFEVAVRRKCGKNVRGLGTAGT